MICIVWIENRSFLVHKAYVLSALQFCSIVITLPRYYVSQLTSNFITQKYKENIMNCPWMCSWQNSSIIKRYKNIYMKINIWKWKYLVNVKQSLCEIQFKHNVYWLPKKSWPISYSSLLYKMGLHFLDIQYALCSSMCMYFTEIWNLCLCIYRFISNSIISASLPNCNVEFIAIKHKHLFLFGIVQKMFHFIW